MYAYAQDTSSIGASYTRILSDIQSAGQCCGFDPPYSCTFGSESDVTINANIALEVPIYCGFEHLWYPPAAGCEFVITLDNGAQ